MGSKAEIDLRRHNIATQTSDAQFQPSWSCRHTAAECHFLDVKQLRTILCVQQVVDSAKATAFQSTEMLLRHEPAWKSGAQGIAVPQD